MSLFQKRKTILDERRKRLSRELADLEKNIDGISRRVRKSGVVAPASWPTAPDGLIGPRPRSVTFLRTALPSRPRAKRAAEQIARLAEQVPPVPPAPAQEPSAAAANAGAAASGDASPHAHAELPAPDEVSRFIKEQGKRLHGERFSDYLSTSFQPARPLTGQRSVQRNKAIAMLIVAVILLAWLICRIAERQ